MKPVVCLLFLLTVSPVFAADALRIIGSTSLLPVMQRIVESYHSIHPELNIEISGGGSKAGLTALLNGSADIAMSSRFIQPREITEATQKGLYPVPFQIAHDAIVPVVHPRNPVRSLTLEQLGAIYRGDVNDWSELGTSAKPLQTVCRDQNSGTRATWQALIANGSAPEKCDHIADTTLSVLESVRNNPLAIGYVSLTAISAHAGVRPLRVNNLACTPACVKSGCYPMTRSLFLFVNGWPDERVMHFIEYTQHSPAAKRAIEHFGLIPAH